jgi:hypothetical protein
MPAADPNAVSDAVECRTSALYEVVGVSCMEVPELEGVDPEKFHIGEQ